MLPVNTSYPSFEANQVLSNEHLNQLFAYLDEQERLTRTNLIGIGIVCGLVPTIAANGTNIRISRGCGVTSEGFLIVWDDPGELQYYKPYTLPEEIRYETFMDDADNNAATPLVQFPLWEMTLDHNNDPAANALTLGFLKGQNVPPGEEDEKIIVLFLECLASENKNCTPNSCDDKGKTIVATVRPLLVRKRDMDEMQQRVRDLGVPGEMYLDLAASAAARLNLPELRLRRFNVAATGLVNTADIFDNYQHILNKPFLDQVAQAFSAAYTAFKPLLQGSYSADPFSTLPFDWAYLHNGFIESQNKYLWYQYYYDHLDILIQAYNEFRDIGLEVIGLCCSDSRLFPRHLMLGKGIPGEIDAAYRHYFVPSPLFSRFQGTYNNLLLLFDRLTTLVNKLELPPLVSAQGPAGNRLVEIKITPSKLGSFPLSEKAIPYHYAPDPLYRYWDYRKSRQGKERYNLGYRAPAWNNTDDFVLNPLRYDFEPNNFMRIEGHMGQSFTAVLQELIAQKQENRLPIEIIALKTGRNSKNIPLPEDLEGCHFQDLETLYDALREELRCNLCESVMYFYNLPIKDDKGQPLPGAGVKKVPQMALLQQCSPNFRYLTGTVGEVYEQNLAALNAMAYPNLDPLAPNPLTGISSLLVLLLQNQVPSDSVLFLAFIYYLEQVSLSLDEDLNLLDYADLENKYSDLEILVRLYDTVIRNIFNNTATNSSITLPQYIRIEDLLDQLDQILVICKLDPIHSVHEEFLRRVQHLRDLLLLSAYTQKNPGIQHKAGVPLGGTFILVYHGDDQVPGTTKTQIGRFIINGRVVADGDPLVGATIQVAGKTFGAVTDIAGNFTLILAQLPATLRVVIPGFPTVQRLVLDDKTFLLIDVTNVDETSNPLNRFTELFPGEVIADFYLPYICCSDCAPVQFVLPKIPPTFTWVQQGCTVESKAPTGAPLLTGNIIVTPQGGTAPYQYSTDGGQTWTDLPAGPIPAPHQGQLLIRDATQTLSAPRTIVLRPVLEVTLTSPEPPCNADGTEYRTILNITGGLAPYFVDGAALPTGQSTQVVSFPSGQSGTVLVKDSSNDCEIAVKIEAFTCASPCNLPCKGNTLECGYLLWMQPPPNDNSPYLEIRLAVEGFIVSGDTDAAGNPKTRTFTKTELAKLSEILKPPTNISSASQFHATWLSKMPNANEFIRKVLSDTFPDQPFGVMQWSYSPLDTSVGLAVLRIEHYECQQFEITVRVQYRTPFNQNFMRVTTYTQQGTKVQVTANEKPFGNADLPAFDCIRRDYCNPNTPPESLCKKPIAFDIKVLKQSGLVVQTEISPTPGTADQVYWEFSSGQDSVATGPIGQTKFPTTGSYQISAILVSENTCAATNTIKVSVTQDGTPPGGIIRGKTTSTEKVKKTPAAPKKKQ